VATLVASPEYYDDVGGSDQNWLTQAYKDLFGRTPTGNDPTAGQLAKLAQNPGTTGRTAVLLGFANVTGQPVAGLLANDEYERNLVAGLENKYLGTNFGLPAPANDSGLPLSINTLVGRLDHGESVAAITASILGSTRYYANDGEVMGAAAGPGQLPGSTPAAVAYWHFTSAGQTIQDLAVLDPDTGTVRIYQGTASGGFSPTPAAILNLPGGAGATALAVGNFNGDGLDDIAVANTALAGATGQSVRVFMNTSTIQAGQTLAFGVAQDYNGGNNPAALVAADVDGDGAVDLVVADSGPDANTGNYVVTVLPGTGSTAQPFDAANPLVLSVATPQNPGAGDVGSPTALALADLHDLNPTTPGLPDLVVGGRNGAAVLFNHSTPGGPSFTAPAAALLPGSSGLAITSLATGTLDRTGLPDIVATTDEGNGQVIVFQNNVTSVGTFTTVSFPAGPSPRAVHVADLNGDGLGDIVLVNDTGNGTLSVLRNAPTLAHTQMVVLTRPASGANSFQLTFDGQTTAPLPDNVSASDLQNALFALGNISGVSGTVTVTGAPGGPYLVTFGGNLAGPGNPLMTGAGTASPVVSPQVLFTAPVSYGSLGDNPVALALADTNDDHLFDAAVANAASDTFAVIPGFTPGTFRTSSDAAFLQAVYLQALNRPADQAAFASWLPGLPGNSLVALQGPSGNISPLAIATQDNLTLTLTFAPQVLDGAYTLSLGGIVQGVAISDTAGNPMTQRFAGPVAVNSSDDGLFVSGLYHDLLGPGPGGRAADTPGFLVFVGLVDPARFQAIGLLAPGLVGSPENVGNILNGYYALLGPGRTAPPSLVSAVAGGNVTEQQVEALVLASDEYYGSVTGSAKLTGSANATWLDSVYVTVLGRHAGGDRGAAALLGALNGGQLSRLQVAQFIVYSAEGLGRLVSDA
jgi:hypothetical protein